MHIGSDIIEIDRFRNKPIKKNNSFYSKLFSQREMECCLKYSDPYPHLAGIFACKEAIKKCTNRNLTFRDIEIVRLSGKKPVASIKNEIISSSSVTISHTNSLAFAVAGMIL